MNKIYEIYIEGNYHDELQEFNNKSEMIEWVNNYMIMESKDLNLRVIDINPPRSKIINGIKIRLRLNENLYNMYCDTLICAGYPIVSILEEENEFNMITFNKYMFES
jgi:hypothetical protein